MGSCSGFFLYVSFGLSMTAKPRYLITTPLLRGWVYFFSQPPQTVRESTRTEAFDNSSSSTLTLRALFPCHSLFVKKQKFRFPNSKTPGVPVVKRRNTKDKSKQDENKQQETPNNEGTETICCWLIFFVRIPKGETPREVVERLCKPNGSSTPRLGIFVRSFARSPLRASRKLSCVSSNFVACK